MSFWPATSPGKPAIAPTGAGYLALDKLGVAPTPLGDEQFLNFNVPSFVYAGQPYTRIGVDSNGYLVVGGMTAADNVAATASPAESGSAEQCAGAVLV